MTIERKAGAHICQSQLIHLEKDKEKTAERRKAGYGHMLKTPLFTVQ